MASSSFLSNTCFLRRNPNYGILNLHRRKRRRTSWGTMAAYRILASLESGEKPTRLVTFLGKGGSGKTTTAVIAAQHYANIGLRTCLAVQSQDLTSEYLLGCKIGYSTTSCNDNLTVVRLETTKMILEPLNQLKKADARLNLTQGVLDGVVGEELGVLPGMDPILSLVALERWIEFLGARFRGSKSSLKFDVIVYDGRSEETLRMIGASERARWYLKYFRSLTEKTDIGRLVGPSLLKLAEESVRLSGTYNSDLSSSEVWDAADDILREASALFMDPSRFGCYLVMDPLNSIFVDSALRYWGCAIQAGALVSGAFAFAADYSDNLICAVKEKLSPLCFELVPHIATHRDVQWGSTLKELKDVAGKLFQKVENSSNSSITFDQVNRTVSLFMPGFDKSEVKLFQQYRGRSELLVEAGDQRRVIRLPGKLQGKVDGAKFIDRNLVIKIN